MRKYGILATLFVATAVAYKCTKFTVPLNITAESQIPAFAEFKSSYDAVQFLNNVTTWAYASQSPFSGSRNITVPVNIATQYCYPVDTGNASTETVQVLTHGIVSVVSTQGGFFDIDIH
jgi:hypothetical protein